MNQDPQQAHRLQQPGRQTVETLEMSQQTDAQTSSESLQFRALAEYSGDHLFMLDRKGRYLFSNDHVSTLGLSRGAELMGRQLQEVFPNDAGCLYRQKLAAVFATGRPVSFWHEAATGQGARYHLVMLYPIRKKNHTWAVGGICRDMSTQRQMESQLFQAQKMEALGTLVAGVAHEINNPINLLLFNLPLFKKMWRDLLPCIDGAEPAQGGRRFGGLTLDFIKSNMLRLITDMELAANRVARIVKGLKAFSRKGNEADQSDIQVNVAVENAVRLASSTFAKSQTELQVVLCPYLPLKRANLQHLEQIVLNLIINALESIDHDHGCVRVETKWQEDQQVIKIVVADNGRGIGPDIAEKIFDPFVTDRQARGGTGLGLSVTYNLVKAHGGDIVFHSSQGQGSEFVVSLPTTDKRRAHRVMVVDDDDGFRALLTQALGRKTASTVEGFSNGMEALIRLGGDPPDLLILDMFLPEIDGLAVCRAIKNELGLERMKVIIVTGYPEHPDLKEVSAMGFRRIVTKPLEIDQFIKIVQNELHGTSS